MTKSRKNRNVVIKVVGAGGAGGNAVNHMINEHVDGVSFIVANTDQQDLANSNASTKIQIGPKLTRGQGAGSNPKVGFKAAQESSEDISDALKGADMVFVTAGMGGGTGTGSAPVIAKIARAQGALTIGVVTRPFRFEGPRRCKYAENGLKHLRKNVDSLITIDNDNLLKTVGRKTSLVDSFKQADDVLRKGVQGITNLITNPGYINLDFADIKTVMKNQGNALMGVGQSSSSKRTVEATREAISSPLLEHSADNAKQVLLNIAAGKNLSLFEANQASKEVARATSNNVNLIFGTSIDKQLGDKVLVTVIATGITDDKSNKNGKLKKSVNSNQTIHRARPNTSEIARPHVTGSKHKQKVVRPRIVHPVQHTHSYKIDDRTNNKNSDSSNIPFFDRIAKYHPNSDRGGGNSFLKNFNFKK